MTANPRAPIPSHPKAGPLKWFRLLGTLLLLCLTLTSARAAESDGVPVLDLLARGQDQRYWITLVLGDTPVDASKPTTAPANAAKPGAVTSVRALTDPVRGTWAEIARLGLRVTAAAPLGDRLAVLTDTGEWRLLWAGNSVVGPPPPGGLVPSTLASVGQTLWAVCRPPPNAAAAPATTPATAPTTAPAGPSVWKWTESAGWARVADLPASADRPGLALGAFADAPWLAWPATTATRLTVTQPTSQPTTAPATLPAFVPDARVAVWDGARWAEPLGTIPAADQPQFVIGAAAPLLVGVRGGDLALWQVAGDRASIEPFRRVPFHNFVDVAAVGPTLRLVTVENRQLSQTAIDDAGRGPVHPPSVLPEPTSPGPSRNEWSTVLMLAMLVAVTLATLRPRPDPATGATTAAAALAPGLRPAPTGRRLLAGLIDLLPALVTAYVVFGRFEGTADDLKHSPTRIFLPMFLAAAVCLAHVTAGELWTGKSVGKWLLGLRVVGLDGQAPGGERVLLRNLLRAIDCMGLPLIFVLVSPLGQRLGDVAARTIVVRDKAGVSHET